MGNLVRDLEGQDATAEDLQIIVLFSGDSDLVNAALQILLNRSLEEFPRELATNLVPELEGGIVVVDLQ